MVVCIKWFSCIHSPYCSNYRLLELYHPLIQSEAGIWNALLNFPLSHLQYCFISEDVVVCLIECGMSLRTEQPHHDTIWTQTCLDRHSAPPVCPNPSITSQIVCKLNTHRPYTNRSSSCLCLCFYAFFSVISSLWLFSWLWRLHYSSGALKCRTSRIVMVY